MGKLTRLYVAASCVVLGALLAVALFLGSALWIVPEWVRELTLDVSMRLARASGALPGREGAPWALSAAPVDPWKAPTPGAAGESPADNGARGNPSFLPGPAGESLAHLEGLEARLRSLEAAVACLDLQGSQDSLEMRARLMERDLEAWSRIRAPLLRLVRETTRNERFGDGAEIHRVWRDVARELTALREKEALLAAGGILRGVDARTLARVLAEEDAFSDTEAVDLLSRCQRPQAAEVLERLTRLSPDRAGRLLRSWTSMQAGPPRQEGEIVGSARRS